MVEAGSLRQACTWRVAKSLATTVWHLDITQQEHQVQLSRILDWFLKHYACHLSSWLLQDQLYKQLIGAVRKKRNVPVYFAMMLLLCPKVTIDQIPVLDNCHQEDHVEDPGLMITPEECQGILDLLGSEWSDHSDQTTAGRSVGQPLTLPTNTLVLESIYFLDPDFLPQLIQMMPGLRHTALQVRYHSKWEVLRALSTHCPKLESLCFLEPYFEPVVPEPEIWSVLFGVRPPNLDPEKPESLLPAFARDAEYRKKFIPQFPNLSKLDLDELTYTEEILHDVYVLALLLYPKLVSFGKHSGLTRSNLLKYLSLYAKIHGTPLNVLSLTKAKFAETVYVVNNDADQELPYLEKIKPIFSELKAVELQKSYWTGSDVGRFCRLFPKSMDTFSLSDLPTEDMSCLAHVTHLRLTVKRQYISFDTVHLILDSCPHLRTLSIHPTLSHHLHHPNPLQALVQDDNINQFPADPLEEGNQEQELDQFIYALAMWELHLHGEDAPAPAAAPGPPQAPRQPRVKYKLHPNLTVLRIASLCKAEKEHSERFLEGLLQRVPNVTQLCLGLWIGALSLHRHRTCTATTLVNVLTRAATPLLPHVSQVCCLPSGTRKEMVGSLVRLCQALPRLHTLVLPMVAPSLLAPALKFFQHSNIDIQYKCATDQVFTSWVPDH